MSASRVLFPLLLLTLAACHDEHHGSHAEHGDFGGHGDFGEHGSHYEPSTSASSHVSTEGRHGFPEALPVSHPTEHEPFAWSPPDLTAQNQAYANRLAREDERESMFDALLLLPWAVLASQPRSPSFSPADSEYFLGQADGDSDDFSAGGPDAGPAPGWSDYYFGTYRPGSGPVR